MEMYPSGVFIVDFEQNLYIFIMSLVKATVEYFFPMKVR